MLRFKSYFLTESDGRHVGGAKVEKRVESIARRGGFLSPNHKGIAGSSSDAPDVLLARNGQDHKLEVKQNSRAMMGQLELHHDPARGGWHVGDKSAAKYPKTAAEVGRSGFLDKINAQWSKPSKDYKQNLKMGNVYHDVKGVKAITSHYGADRGTPYIHIGGSGTYHTGKDSAGTGAPALSGDTRYRARTKNRGTDEKTGKTKFGHLITFVLKNPKPSTHDLEKDPSFFQSAK